MTSGRKPNSLLVPNAQRPPVTVRAKPNQGNRNIGVAPVTSSAASPPLHLPLHLREVCAILAASLVRLRRRTAEDFARGAGQAGGRGESSLHYAAHQSGHADSGERPTA